MLVFKKVRAALGFSKCRVTLVGAAPIHRQTLEYFMGVDIPVLELYGMSECTGPQTLSLKSHTKWRTGSCGKTISGVEMRIDNPDEHGDGEVSDVSNDSPCDDVICVIATPTNYCLLIVWTVTITDYTEGSL